jgi:predicted transcriptional regulator
MKCLSLRQPYADLLARGEKAIELRKWNTKFRGEFLIHASKNIDIEACERLNINDNELTKGTIIGSAFLYDVKQYNNKQEFNKDRDKHLSIVSKYFEGYKYCFLIRNAKVLKKPIPCPGKLKFFEVNNLLLSKQ